MPAVDFASSTKSSQYLNQSIQEMKLRNSKWIIQKEYASWAQTKTHSSWGFWHLSCVFSSHSLFLHPGDWSDPDWCDGCSSVLRRIQQRAALQGLCRPPRLSDSKTFLKQTSSCFLLHTGSVFFLLRELSAFPCSGQFKSSDPCLCVSVHACQCAHVWLLICVIATGFHWSGFRLIPALIQIMSQMMINCFFSLTRSRRTKAMNSERDKRWNSFSTTIRSCLPERSLPPPLPPIVWMHRQFKPDVEQIPALTLLYKYVGALSVRPIFTI